MSKHRKKQVLVFPELARSGYWSESLARPQVVHPLPHREGAGSSGVGPRQLPISPLLPRPHQSHDARSLTNVPDCACLPADMRDCPHSPHSPVHRLHRPVFTAPDGPTPNPRPL
jgi:hypothetical protein